MYRPESKGVLYFYSIYKTPVPESKPQHHGQAIILKSHYFPTDPSDTAPDLNITLSPGSDLRVGDRLNVTCTADKPRYQFPKRRILPPVYIGIFLGNTLLTSQRYEGKQDQERIKLIPTINLTMAENNVMVTCQTRNSDSTCRVKILQVNVADRALRTYVMSS